MSKANKKWLDFIRLKLKDKGKLPKILEFQLDEDSSDAIYQVLDLEEREGEIHIELRDNFNGEHLSGSLDKLMFEERYHRILLGMDPAELAPLLLFAAVREIQQAEDEERDFRFPKATWILLADLVGPESGTLH